MDRPGSTESWSTTGLRGYPPGPADNCSIHLDPVDRNSAVSAHIRFPTDFEWQGFAQDDLLTPWRIERRASVCSSKIVVSE